MNQKEGTYSVVSAVLKANKKTIDPTTPVVLTSEERAECIAKLSVMFSDSQISCSRTYEAKELKTYCGGLLSNWLKKDKRLNGNVDFELQKPGSRADNVTPAIVELRKLRRKVKGTPNEAKVQSILNEEIAKHKAARNKEEIDFDLIPEELQNLVS